MKAWAWIGALAGLSFAGAVSAQSPAGAPVSAETGTTFVQVGRLLDDPSTGRVQRDKTLVIQGNRIVEVRDGFVG
ncbi:MAG: amidohydrolase family protein, partial [Brevundimonas sp.]